MVQIVLLLLLTGAFIFAIKNPKLAFKFSIFSVPWYGVDVDFGLRFTPYLIITVPLMLVTLFTHSQNRLNLLAKNKYIVIILLYSILIYLIQIPFLPDYYLDGGIGRQPIIRGLTQIIFFIINISPIILATTYIKNKSDLSDCFKYFLYSTALIGLVGFLQLYIWRVTGTDPFPIGFFDNLFGTSGELRSGNFDYLELSINRMSAFGGEPKNLVVNFVVALLIIQCPSFNFKFKKYLWIFYIACLFLTYSTMGYIAWALATIIQFLIFYKILIRNNNLIKIIISFSLFVVILYLIFGEYFNSIFDLLTLRTYDRLMLEEEGGFLEDFNLAIFNFLIDNPLYILFGTGLGNAHLFSISYIPDFAAFYMENRVYVAKSYVIKWISELGLITFIWFIYFYLKHYLYGIKIEKRYSLYFISGLGIPLLMSLLISSYFATHFFIYLGLLIAFINIYGKKN